MTKMDEKYGDGSDHEVCDGCGYCKTCGDCDCKPVLICPRCKVDRLKLPCPDNSMNCPMRGEAYTVPNMRSLVAAARGEA